MPPLRTPAAPLLHALLSGMHQHHLCHPPAKHEVICQLFARVDSGNVAMQSLPPALLAGSRTL